jgi:hypothetical protein
LIFFNTNYIILKIFLGQKKEILKSIQDYIDNYDINTEAESLAILSNIVEKLQVISRSTIDKLKISQDSLDLVNYFKILFLYFQIKCQIG